MSAAAPLPDGLPLWRLGDDVGAMPQARRFIATVPGAEAPLFALTLPPTLRGAARVQVARRQVQDRLGVDGVALWPLQSGAAWTHAVVVTPERVRAWRQQAQGAGKACVAIVPDYLALPAAEGLWVLDAQGDVLRARLGLNDGFTAEPDLALAMLARAQPAPRAIWVQGDGIDPAALPAGVEVIRDPAAWRLTVPAGAVMGVDLATDPASDAAAPLARTLRAAMVPMALALSGAASWSAATVIETNRDLAAAEATRQAVTQAVRADILPTGPIIDLRAQVLRAVDARRAGVVQQAPLTALGLLRLASAGLAEVETVQLSLSDAPALTARVQAPDFATLERALQRWQEAGLSAETQQSGTGVGGGVSAQVRITGGTP